MAVKLVLLPGMDGTGLLFDPLLRALQDSAEAVVVRYPTDEPLGYAELLPRVRDLVPETSDFVLLGESFSGPLAILLAAERPAGLRGVILSASFAANPIRWFPRWALPLVQPALFRLQPRLAHLKALLGRHGTPELRRQIFAAVSSVQPAVLAARARAILTVDVMAQFQACPYPILYLRGERDRVVGRHVLRRLLQARPSLEVATLRTPHLVLQVAPEEAARVITGWKPEAGGRSTLGESGECRESSS